MYNKFFANLFGKFRERSARFSIREFIDFLLKYCALRRNVKIMTTGRKGDSSLTTSPNRISQNIFIWETDWLLFNIVIKIQQKNVR